MASCCVANCSNKKANNPDVIFFNLPDQLTRQWRLVINRNEWMPKKIVNTLLAFIQTFQSGQF